MTTPAVVPKPAERPLINEFTSLHRAVRHADGTTTFTNPEADALPYPTNATGTLDWDQIKQLTARAEADYLATPPLAPPETTSFPEAPEQSRVVVDRPQIVELGRLSLRHIFTRKGRIERHAEREVHRYSVAQDNDRRFPVYSRNANDSENVIIGYKELTGYADTNADKRTEILPVRTRKKSHERRNREQARIERADVTQIADEAMVLISDTWGFHDDEGHPYNAFGSATRTMPLDRAIYLNAWSSELTQPGQNRLIEGSISPKDLPHLLIKLDRRLRELGRDPEVAPTLDRAFVEQVHSAVRAYRNRLNTNPENTPTIEDRIDRARQIGSRAVASVRSLTVDRPRIERPQLPTRIRLTLDDNDRQAQVRASFAQPAPVSRRKQPPVPATLPPVIQPEAITATPRRSRRHTAEQPAEPAPVRLSLNNLTAELERQSRRRTRP